MEAKDKYLFCVFFSFSTPRTRPRPRTSPRPTPRPIPRPRSKLRPRPWPRPILCINIYFSYSFHLLLILFKLQDIDQILGLEKASDQEAIDTNLKKDLFSDQDKDQKLDLELDRDIEFIITILCIFFILFFYYEKYVSWKKELELGQSLNQDPEKVPSPNHDLDQDHIRVQSKDLIVKVQELEKRLILVFLCIFIYFYSKI